MNKYLYRKVLNNADNTLMVVARNKFSKVKSTRLVTIPNESSDMGYMEVTRRSFASKVVASFLIVVMPLSNAQIIADPTAPGNQRPTVLTTANGLPQVNIQAPSAAGVSRNTYSQFDVQSQGAILNNSRTSVQTQTGGWVQGNPWLVGGAARVILNEVNSSNPSQLRGYIEVAGQRAEVIIANPAGIQVNGGGFINADRVTLVTGTATMNPANGGSLDSYRIPQGTISIDGLGLDTRTATYTDILARSVQVNAGIWANRLKVVTGANEISTTQTDYPGNVANGVTAIAGTGPTPQFSLDVAALGGMYAGHIYMVGSESGLGVRNKGAIGASDGNLVLLSNGYLTNEGAIQAGSTNGSAGNLKIETAGSITNTGTNAIISAQGNAEIVTAADLINAVGSRMNATRSLTITTAGTLTNAGKLAAAETVTVNAFDVENTVVGEIAGVTTKVTAIRSLTNRGLIDGGETRLQADTVTNIGTGRIYGDHLGIAANVLNNDTELVNAVRSDAVIAARERLDLGITTLNNKNGALIFSAGEGVDALNIGESLDAQAKAIGTADTINNEAATIESLGSVAISAQKINNINPDFSVRTDTKNDPTYVHYIRLGGVRYLESELGRCYKCASDRFDDGSSWLPRLEYVAPSAQYPFDAGYSRIPYLIEVSGFSADGAPETTPVDYPADSNVWALFNVPVGDQGTLRANLLSYNLSMISRAYRDYFHVWVTNTQTIETVVDNPGAPGRIVSGGAMTLTGAAILNDNSHILAGGNLDIVGGTLTNTETSGNRQVTDFGTFRGDSVKYKGYGVHEGYFGSGGISEVIENVTTKLDTSIAEGNRVVAGTGTQLASRSAPTSSLLRITPDSTAAYLYETDPRFTNHKQWLSSDYMLQVFATDPTNIQKRLGDGFYEQKLIREQVAELTGRRFLDSYASDEAQYQALMDAGITYAKQWNLVPGVALSSSQMAQLTSDIVWLVSQEVTLADGSKQTVLVPQVYLQVREGNLRSTGALIAGSDVYIKTQGLLANSGHISAANEVTLLAGTDLVNQGGRIDGRDIYVYASNDLKNVSGLIQGTGNASQVALSAGRDVILETRTITAQSATSELVSVDRIATVQGGTVSIDAGRDFVGKGSAVRADQDLAISAGRDISISAVENSSELDVRTGGSFNSRTGYIQEKSISNQLATLDAGNNVSLVAGTNGNGDIRLRGVDIAAGNNAQIQGSNVTIEAVKDVKFRDQQYVSGESYARFMKGDETLTGGNIVAGNSINVRATGDPSTTLDASGVPLPKAGTGDVLLSGATLNATNGQLAVVANNDVVMAAMATEHSSASESYNKLKGFLTQTTTIQNHFVNSSEAQVSSLNSAKDAVTITAGNNIILEGTQINAKKDATLYAGNQLLALAAYDTFNESRYDQTFTSGIHLSISGFPVSPETRGIADGKTNTSRTAQGTSVRSEDSNVTLFGVGAVGLEGTVLKAEQGNVGIGGGVIDIRAATDFNSSTTSHVDKGSKMNIIALHKFAEGLGAVTTETTSLEETTLARTTIEGKNVSITALGGDTHIAGTTIETPGTLAVSAVNGTVAFDGQQTDITTSKESSVKDYIYQKMEGKGSTEQVTNYNVITAATITIDAPNFTAQIGSKDSVAQLAAQPGMEWINQLANDPVLKDRIDWKKVEDASKNWDYKAQGLTAVGAAVVVIVMTFLTAGAASSAGGSVAQSASMATSTTTAGVTTYTATSIGGSVLMGATTAAVSTLASQAAIALINNQGNLGGALKDLGSSENIKGLIAAVITGGVLQGLKLSPTGEATAGAGAQDFTTQLKQNLQAGAAKALINTAVYGGSLEDNLKSSFLTAFIDTAAAQTAFSIGKNLPPGTVPNLLAHALAGCAAGAVRVDGSCGAGALGASIGELAAIIYDPYGINLPGDTVRFASMIGGIAAAISGLDVAGINLASQAAGNAAANNYVSRSPFAEVRRAVNQENARLTNECGTSCTEQDFQRIDQQMAVLERGMNLSAAASRTTLTPEQAGRLAQILLELAPIYGTGESLVQLVTGHSSLTGEEVNSFWAAVGVVPIAGGILRRVGEPSVEALSVVLRKADNLGEVGGVKGTTNIVLFEEMTAKGIKFTPENVIQASKLPDGKIVFLESGNSTSGLQHILDRHVVDFANKGISMSEIPSVVMKAVTEGKIVGTNGAAPVYEIVYNGVTQYISVGVASNGFIVRANPVSTWKSL